jgi:hypothetical protein
MDDDEKQEYNSLKACDNLVEIVPTRKFLQVYSPDGKKIEGRQIKTKVLAVNTIPPDSNLIATILMRAMTDKSMGFFLPAKTRKEESEAIFQHQLLTHTLFLEQSVCIPTIGIPLKAMYTKAPELGDKSLHDRIMAEATSSADLTTPLFTSIEPTQASNSTGKFFFMTTQALEEQARQFIDDLLPTIAE